MECEHEAKGIPSLAASTDEQGIYEKAGKYYFTSVTKFVSIRYMIYNFLRDIFSCIKKRRENIDKTIIIRFAKVADKIEEMHEEIRSAIKSLKDANRVKKLLIAGLENSHLHGNTLYTHDSAVKRANALFKELKLDTSITITK